MSGLGFRPAEVDLRGYFGDAALLRRDLARYDALWVRGGNVFVLRYALHRSGGDTITASALAADTLVYAGYSVGPCVLAPSLRGLDAVDDPAAVTATYGTEPIWEGLGLLDYSIVPHYRSPGHPESAACDGVAAGYRAAGIAHRALRDGEALVIQVTTRQSGDELLITALAVKKVPTWSGRLVSTRRPGSGALDVTGRRGRRPIPGR